MRMPKAIIEIHTEGPKAARMVSSTIRPGRLMRMLTTQLETASNLPA